MSAFLIALFGVAALLAGGCMAFTIRRYAAAALAIGRELAATANPQPPVPGKARSHRHKARLARHAATRHDPGARGARRDPVQHGSQARKTIRKHHFGHGLLLRPGRLVFE